MLLFRDCAAEALGGRDRISLGSDTDGYMRRVYAALREAEREYDVIIVEMLKGGGREASVMNRVMKAVGGKTV